MFSSAEFHVKYLQLIFRLSWICQQLHDALFLHLFPCTKFSTVTLCIEVEWTILEHSMKAHKTSQWVQWWIVC